MVTAERLAAIARPLERARPKTSRRWLTALVCVLVFLLVVVRFFTERIPILPRFLNPVDFVMVPLLLPFCLISISRRGKWKLNERNILTLSGVAVAAWAFSWLININGAYWLGAVLLITGLLTPILFYLILVNFDFGYDSARLILKLILVLFAVNLVIASVDVFMGIDEESADFVFGTFGVNQNQLAFFLASMVCYYFASWLYEGATNWKIVAFIWGLLLFLLCGFQTMWVILPIAGALVFVRYGKLSGRLLLAVSLSSIVPLLVLSLFTFQHFRIFSVLASSFAEFDQLGKVELVENVASIWQQYPEAALIGVGPGSFNSRAFRSIAIVPYHSAEGTDVAATVVDPFYRSVLSDQYIIPYFVRGRFYLSGANTDGPFTSYVSVPVEIGLIGAFGIFGIYAVVTRSLIESLRKTKNARMQVLASWALANILMLLGIAAVDNYLEVTRYTIPVWLSVAIWKISQQKLEPKD
jgi:hypothetical protein